MSDLGVAPETLARAGHERYLAEQTAAGVPMGETPAMATWEALPDDLRQANLDQVADIPAKLAMVGCAAAPAASGDPETAFSDAELELLSVHEHDRWCAQRVAAGWTYAPVRDDAAKHHPSLTPWSELSEPEKDKDRSVVRRIPLLLALGGLRMVRRLG
ncbi:RyR domain-containing protein [Catellatospora methionotrophica]|uniref:RyR domain-containing protein n=1 Tax=Catellatospora methionotrophica TaxID=121620 RepID=UPI0033C9D6FE